MPRACWVSVQVSSHWHQSVMKVLGLLIWCFFQLFNIHEKIFALFQLWKRHLIDGERFFQPPVRLIKVNIKHNRPFHDQVLLEVFKDP